jgi:hypothetical protein
MKWLWAPAHYWPIWLFGLVLGVFGVREFTALATARSQDTFSCWVWHALKVHKNESIGQWDALDFLMFGLYCTVFIWLAFHFFWHRFA